MSKNRSKTPWAQFMDMHSGGRQKLKWSYIYIEAPEEQAESIFYSKFGRNPNRVSCTCCGNDYSVSESPSLKEVTAYNRNCQYAYMDKKGKEVPRNEAWIAGKGLKPGYTEGYVEHVDESKAKYGMKYIPLEEYIKGKDIKVIYEKEITKSERHSHLPEEGYVWIGE